MRRPVFILVLLAVSLAPSMARASWAPDGNPVVTAAGDQYGPVAAPFGSGGVLIAWVDLRGGDPNEADIYAQALTADGSRAPGWPVNGVSVCAFAGLQNYVSVITDAEGAYLTWFDYRATQPAAYLQRLTNQGSIAPGWPLGGLRIGEDTWYSTRPMASDGAGGVFIARHDPSTVPNVERVQRITAAGATAPGWPAEGISLGASQSPPAALLADGSGGVFAASIRYGESNPRAVVHRLTPDGSVHPAWPPTGVMVGDENGFGQWGIGLVPDGAGGVFLTWQDAVICLDLGGCGSQSVVRLDGSGVPPPGWTLAGRKLGPPGSITPDGLGGFLYSSVYFRFNFLPPPPAFARVTRFDGSGERLPGWNANGNPVCTEEGYQVAASTAGDASGGAFTSWVDRRTGSSVLYVTRLDASGRVAPGWPISGSIAAPASGEVWESVVVEAGQGRAIVVWTDFRNGSRDVFAEQVVPGPPGPPAPLTVDWQGGVGFGFKNLRPNPARGAFWAVLELPDATPATLDVIDVAGRVLESRRLELGGPSRGGVRLNVSGSWKPGLYWLRLRQGPRSTATRVVVGN